MIKFLLRDSMSGSQCMVDSIPINPKDSGIRQILHMLLQGIDVMHFHDEMCATHIHIELEICFPEYLVRKNRQKCISESCLAKNRSIVVVVDAVDDFKNACKLIRSA